MRSVLPHKLPVLRPILSCADLDSATALAFRLSESAESRPLSQDEADYLEVLLVLIERYEEARYPIGELPTPLERLRYLARESGLSASDLGRLLGNRALGSKLLSGEREPSKAHIRKLPSHFRIEPGYFI